MAIVPEPCVPFDEDLPAWLDGELDAARGEAVAAHVAGCARCRARVATFRAVDERLRSLPARPVPERLEGRLLARVAAEGRSGGAPAPVPRERGRPRRSPRLGLFLALAAAAALALWLSVDRPPASVAPSLPAPPPAVADLDAASEEELSAAIELETLEDLDVIANLDLLERAVDGENGRG